MKTRKKLSWTLLGDVWIHLTEFHLCFLEQSFITVLRTQSMVSLHRTDAYAEKENIISSKRERSFLRDYFEIWEFTSQGYSLVFRRQFSNTVLVESPQPSLGFHRVAWWKRKCPQIITREKLSERLLSDVWLHHTEFHPSLLETVC